MLTGIVLSVALSATMVEPNARTENHASPYINTQPTIRRFDRRNEENERRLAWEAYTRELSELWIEYREAGSTPRAWRTYNQAVAEARRRYVIADPFYAPVTP